jgi:hypothetical protein
MSDTADDIVRGWIERRIGPITRFERQGRWRPAWYVDALSGSTPLPLYVRGDRGSGVQTQPQPLSFERDLLMLLEESGMRVPHVYGFIDEIPAIVMQRLPGQADLRHAANDMDRDAVTAQFVDQMILMHRVDPLRMEKLGAPRPAGRQAIALAYYHRIVPLYLRTRNRPEPAIEFVRGWIERNTPDAPDIAYPIAVDAGQFIFEGDRLTAMLDFEFAALGDYHADLAALRLRNRLERVGDIGSIYRQYAQRSGLAVDMDRIRYHTVIKGLLPPLQMAGNLGKPIRDMDYVQYLIWNQVWLRIALESIAEMKGWKPEPFTPPSAARDSRAGSVIEAMSIGIESDSATDELAAYQRGRHLRTLRYLQRLDRWQHELENRYLEDVRRVTGAHHADWHAADAALEIFVQQASPAQDETLLRLLWRQLLGQCWLLDDPREPANHELLASPLESVILDVGVGR